MATGYYLQDNPNPTTAQYGWPRSRVSGVIGVHTAENNLDFEGADPGAEDVAGFISRRSDHGSYHVLADADSIRPLAHPSWSVWADTTNNAHAMSVSGAVQAARWRDLTQARADQVVTNMAVGAAMMVQTAIRDGLLSAPVPARRISAAEAISGSRAGFYGHGETNPGTRYDPGAHFNWDLFLAQYQAAVTGGTLLTVGNTIEDWWDSMNDDEKHRLLSAADRINGTIPGRNHSDGRPVQVLMEDTGLNKGDGAWSNGILGDLAVLGNRILDAVGGTKEEQKALAGAVEALRLLVVQTDTTKLDPAAVAAQVMVLLPDDIAQDVVDAMGRTLTKEG